MKLVAELANELLECASVGDIQKCMELAERINKIMDTYKRSC